MVHTIELSRMISKEMFETLLKTVKGCRYNRVAHFSKAYVESGIQMVCLRKFKPRKKDKKGNWITLEESPFFYMVILSVNTGLMFGGDGYLSNDIHTFTPDFAKAVYAKIFEQIPELELYPEKLIEGRKQQWETGYSNILLEDYFSWNAFKLRRIDFAFDIAVAPEQYMQLLEWGKGMRCKWYERKYYDKQMEDSEDNPEEEEIEDDEPDFEDMEDLMYEYEPETNYIYYKSKSTSINIYLKQEQLVNAHLIDSEDDSYHFLRLEFQIRKNAINARNKRLGIKGREFHQMAIPELEARVLKYYTERLSYSGIHMSCANAKKVIDSSMEFGQLKKQRMKRLLDLIAAHHGVEEVIEKAKRNKIPEYPSVGTLMNHLTAIKKMGINPVNISKTMNASIEPQIFTDIASGQQMSIRALVALVDIVSAYNEQIKQEQQQGKDYTASDFEQIDKL